MSMPAIPAIPGIRFDHVSVSVADLDAQVAWYQRALGFARVRASPTSRTPRATSSSSSSRPADEHSSVTPGPAELAEGRGGRPLSGHGT
jgi:catechol 2,3-dioxygenase-like lactoylglutathione lyase family enzyme